MSVTRQHITVNPEEIVAKDSAPKNGERRERTLPKIPLRALTLIV